jgi:D-amino peptidase
MTWLLSNSGRSRDGRLKDVTISLGAVSQRRAKNIMKLFISVDMEGVACVTHRDHVKMEGREYELARKWMTGEANAAIEGALDVGASTIVVADGHGFMHNLLPEELHQEVTLVSGSPRPLLQLEGLDTSFDAAFFVGYHARAGDALGTLAHTYVGRIVYEVRLNGTAVSEATFNASVAGHFGVPVALVAGDDALANEVAETIPWAERVITKWAISPFAARNLTPSASQSRIKAAAKVALERLKEMKPLKLDGPIFLEVEFLKNIYAYLVADIPGVVRVDGTTVSFQGADMLEVNRIWRLMINASLSDFPV